MPKKNSHRMKGVQLSSIRKSVKSLPILFNLPEDLSAVRQLAFAYAMENAYQARKQHLPATDEKSLEAGAIEEAIRWEKKVVNGRVGTNDGPLFRTTYMQTFMRVYPAFVKLLEKKPFAFTVLDRLTDAKRLGRFEAFSAQQLAQLESTPVDVPLEIEW